MHPLQPHISLKTSLLFLQLVMVVASIPHFHSSPSSEGSVVTPIGATDHATQHAMQVCMECVLSGTWIAEPAASAEIASTLCVRGSALILPVPPAAKLATAPAHPRGPPLY